MSSKKERDKDTQKYFVRNKTFSTNLRSASYSALIGLADDKSFWEDGIRDGAQAIGAVQNKPPPKKP